MTGIDDQVLIAYADGELNEIERARVEEALAGDPALRERLEAQRRVRDRLAAFYGPVADEDVPDRLRAVLESNVVGIGAARERRRQIGWRDLAALAATLVIGIVLGQAVLERGPGQVAVEDGMMMARGELADALETQLASAQPADAPVRIGVTFPAEGGGLCRTFEASAMAGLACRGDSGWRLVMTAAASGGTAGEYRQAGSGSALVFQAAQEMMSGDPLDPEAERHARATGWRNEASAPRRD